MMRKIGYLLPLEFVGIEFSVGAERHWRVKVMILGGRTDLPTLEYGGRHRFSCRSEGEYFNIFHNTEHEEDTTIVHMRFVVEIQEETRECVAIAPAPVPTSTHQRDQPMGEDSEEPMEEEFFEESRTEGPF
ncbi:hypothetical protein GUJ93_ZPchr0010g10487 [Zizania palustris]|uniref:Uncharacterized protein n=1 Tax=Zizania palustris TaxID=103762 RepID=A0A8J5WF20_ZIZPA|nr:hypothetical protein GUJ93_ZPchr0010g10487 [Zizania palustris]